ncbi:unnamed protein product [Darwinula stevensoni]|uniref:COMM domain-containing protein n=1 Tax=Darwinula stevensoni TaxID=69355 RepID=A0A7R8XBT7_9CRUS|nr:unnamed protein product [Darwinula stevensoni]CAG0886835.1 unnamed protein product [Darwinula stevensoni]
MSELVLETVQEMVGMKPPNYTSYAKTMSILEFYDLKSSISKSINATLPHMTLCGYSENQLQQLFPLDSLKNAFSSAIQELHPQLEEFFQKKKTKELSSSSVEGFDWMAKVGLVSDKCARLQEPFLQLHLSLDTCTQKTYEMDWETVSMFIMTLESAAKLLL